MIEFGHATHPGLRHRYNEDSYGIDATSGCFVVVDAMGGPGHGEAIAALARETALRGMRAGTALPAVLRQASATVADWLGTHPLPHPAGAAIALLRLREPDFELAWVGDCTVLLGGSDPAQVAVASALPCADAAHAASVATALLGSGAADELRIGLRSGRLRLPAALLLCSDGVIEASSLQARQRALTTQEIGAQEAVDTLLLDALAQQAHDNLTAVLVRLRR